LRQWISEQEELERQQHLPDNPITNIE